jgi:probable rRNA maturation factor
MNKVEIENKTTEVIDQEKTRQVAMEVLHAFDKDNALAEIIFVTSEEIKKLNQSYRNVEKPTDVLSFPQAKVPGAETEILGSIIICMEILKEKDEQMDDVIKHGFLHLLGFDHEEDENKWQELANKINCKL